jgi:glucose-1-phosphatase
MLNQHVFNKLEISNIESGKIKNIIFDLGGVVINISYQRTVNAFKRIGFDNFDAIYSQIKQTHLFDLLETGQIPPQAFCLEIQKYKHNLSDKDIKQAWSSMIVNMPAEHIPLLINIRKKYNTYVLSNTNAIHIDYFNEYLVKTFGRNPLPDMFDKLYYSHEINQRKPDPEAYETVLADAGLNPDETIFIDDLYANIAGAKKLGIHAYHLENEQISDLFAVPVLSTANIR